MVDSDFEEIRTLRVLVVWLYSMILAVVKTNYENRGVERRDLEEAVETMDKIVFVKGVDKKRGKVDG